MRATTDSNPAVDFETMGPGVANLLAIFQAFSGWTDDQMKSHFTGMRYGDLKKQVAEMVVSQPRAVSAALPRDHRRSPAISTACCATGAERVSPDRQLHGRARERADGAVHGTRKMASRRYRCAPTLQLVRGNRNFRLLWLAQMVSEIGDWLYAVAIYSLMLELTGSAQAVALAVVLQVLPQLLVAPTAGVLNDRLSRRNRS